MQHPNLVIDYHKFCVALRRMLYNPPAHGVDMYTAACRVASGIPDLDLTPEQRSDVKTAAYSVIYGAGPQTFIDALRRSSGSVRKSGGGNG